MNNNSEFVILFDSISDLDDLVQLCELHAIFENCDYDSANKSEQLNEHLFSEKPTLFCLVVEHLAEIVGYATYMKQFSTWDAEFYIYMENKYG